jgi:hypothetical protein
MKRHLLSIMVLTGLFMLLAAGTGLAAGRPPALPPGNSSPLMGLPQSQAASPSPQAMPAGQAAIQPAAADDIRDIRGPLHIPDPLVWLYYAIGACLALGAAAGAWRWFRRHKALRAKRAFEIAFEQLERAKALMKPELADAFSVAVSDAVRTYIEKRFEVRVTRHTTEEFMARIGSEPAGDLTEYSDLLQDFLSHCDLAKFARCVLTIDQMQEMHQSAWEFVDRTRPRPEEKTAEQQTAVPDAVPAASKAPEGQSLLTTLRASWLRFTPNRTTAAAGLDGGSAVAAGGR